MKKIDKLNLKINMLIRRLPGQQGNTLAYIAMVLIIFGVIGVAMISLLTSSVTSSATPNYSRKAQYTSEAGVRYAMSQLRSNDFDSDDVDELNDTTEYVLGTGDKFELNVFSLWFRSASDESGTPVTGNIEEGEIPANFSMTTGNIYAVNIESTKIVGSDLIIPNPDYTESTAIIQGYSIDTDTQITLTPADDFAVNKNERVCLAVHPLASQSPDPNNGDSLFVHADARSIFPKHDGAVYIYNKVVNYDRAIYHDDDPKRLELTNISHAVTVDADNTDDYVILWPSNHLITSKGTSETVSQGAYPASSINIIDSDDLTIGKKGAPAPDLDLKNMNLAGPAAADKDILEKESDSGFITADDTGKFLDIGSGLSTAAFGNVWYDEDKPIGGQTNYCSAGACLFGRGVRVFFTLKYSGDGDGLTFALISAGTIVGSDPLEKVNTAESVGGDKYLSELLGFGGNSLTDTVGPVYEDGSGKGLRPPKIALEFDTLTNNANNDYCQDATTLYQGTRNDPLTDDKDALQYVFWGSKNSLNIVCRNPDPSYDDNRHDAGTETGDEALLWEFQTNDGETKDPIAFGRPAFGSDGTIHVATSGYYSNQAKIYAINPDGTQKWVFPLGTGDTVKYSPGINPTVDGETDDYDDDVYSDFSGNYLVAIDKDGIQRWKQPVGADVDCQPVVMDDGTVLFGSDNSFLNSLHVSDGSWNWSLGTGIDGGLDTIPAIAPDCDITDPVDPDCAIYIVANEYEPGGIPPPRNDGLKKIQIAPPTRAVLWEKSEIWAKDDVNNDLTAINSSPVVDENGYIYVGDDEGNVYAYSSTEASKWADPYSTGDDVDSTPCVDPVSGTIYVGSNDEMVHAIDPLTGTSMPGWPFDIGDIVQSSPIVDSNGTIYVGSEDKRLYAINPDGTLKWSYPDASIPDVELTTGRFRSSPGIGPDGNIYVGDTKGKVYAFSRLANPRNIKDLMVTSEGTSPNFTVGGEPVDLFDADDWLAGDTLKGPWAVRMEVKRSLSATDGTYKYTLRTWIRQCEYDSEAAPSECTDPDIIGTFFQDTRLEYDARTPHLEQTIALNQDDHDLFESFLFGFTGASGDGVSQNAIIEKLQLSFIRPGDPVIPLGGDPHW